MEENNKNKFLNAVRTVGIIKPWFNPNTREFEPPRLEVFGTGFWFTEGVFVTCEHVVRDVMNKPIENVGLLVIGGNKKPYRKASIVIYDALHDLVVLQVKPNDDNDAQILNSEIKDGLTICKTELEVGDEICYAGFPLGSLLLNEVHSPSYAEGVIGSEIIDDKPGPKTIQISGPVIGGYSGAPIVTKSDMTKVVGLVSHSPTKEAGQASIFRAIHWKHIKELIELMSS